MIKLDKIIKIYNPKKATVKDVNGSKYVLEAMDKGMEITNTDNELMESIVVGNNYISVSGDKVIINGKTMRPPHSADIKAVTTTVTTTTTTATTTTTTSKKTEKKTQTQTGRLKKTKLPTDQAIQYNYQTGTTTESAK